MFVSNLLPQVFSGLRKGQNIDVLVAVVDRITLPSNTLQGAGIHSLHPQLGLDGISLWTMNSERAVPDLWANQNVSIVGPSKSKQELDFLEFKISVNTPNWLKVLHQRHLTLRLGLANTTFENGQPNTCFAQQWTMGSDGSESLDLKRQRYSPQCTINLPLLHPPASRWLNLPKMEPLTSVQVVSEAQGNVIRTVRAFSDPSSTEPASKALEDGIARLLASPPQTPYETWARVVDGKFWPGAAPVYPQHVPPYSPFRYLKVISGGGGYNSRQGLLALDPEPVFPEGPLLDFDDLTRSQRVHDELFASVVRPGDVIQFYAVIRPDVHSAKSTHRPPTQDREAHLQPEMWVIGNTPSLGFGSLDSSQGATDLRNPDQVKDWFQCLVLKHFGASSEPGLWLKVDVPGDSVPGPSGPLPLRSSSKTRLPPFSTFRVQVSRPPRGRRRILKWPCTDSDIHTPIVNRFIQKSSQDAQSYRPTSTQLRRFSTGSP